MNSETDNVDDVVLPEPRKTFPKLRTKFPVTLSIIDNMIENSYIFSVPFNKV
jgi:hypothetical protein